MTQLEILQQPPLQRPDTQPWPTMPMIYKVTSAHEEGGQRRYAVETKRFLAGDDGRVGFLELANAGNHDDHERELLPAQLVLVAAGFVGPELGGDTLANLATTTRGTLQVSNDWKIEGCDNVFACGDAVRGQSLIVWAIAEGRSAAVAVNEFLDGPVTLPTAPLAPYVSQW